MIVFEDVHFSYRDRKILHGISFEVAEGETMAILGGSGSGKTTILRLLLGFMKPDAGRILVDDTDIVPLRERDLIEVRRKMGIVFQFGALFDSLTVGDNVAFPLRELRTMTEAAVIDRVTRVVQQVGLDPRVLDLMPSELSGGMNRRVAIARAIVHYPQFLLYDEPTTGLDPLACRMICDLVVQLRDEFGVTAIFVTHQLAAAFRVATHFVVLRHGHLIFDGTASELREVEDPYISQFIRWELGGLLDGTTETGHMERSPGWVDDDE
jgi:phospholipid/cholesterol/gamma-HCH transport system ATP-binding protein